jgi:formylglycine-generating enzyme required for sulfatase activity
MAILTMFTGETAPVGSYFPNAFGLYDMHGNVHEWCIDRWHDNYNNAPSNGKAWLDGENHKRVMRGGSWDAGSTFCRSATRNFLPVGHLSSIVGFRVVCEVFPGG